MNQEFVIQELVVSRMAASALSVTDIESASKVHQSEGGFLDSRFRLISLHYSSAGMPFWMITSRTGAVTDLKMDAEVADWFVVEQLVISHVVASLLTVKEIRFSIMCHQIGEGCALNQRYKTFLYARDLPHWVITKNGQTMVVMDIVGWDVELIHPAVTDNNATVVPGTTCSVLKHDYEAQMLFVTSNINGRTHCFYVHEECVLPLIKSAVA